MPAANRAVEGKQWSRETTVAQTGGAAGEGENSMGFRKMERRNLVTYFIQSCVCGVCQ